MAPGFVVYISPEWRYAYRRPGAAIYGVVTSLSPTSAIARIHMDDVGDSYVRTEHLRPLLLDVVAKASSRRRAPQVVAA